MSYAVKYSWHPPVGAFTRKADAQAMAKRMRDANRQAGLKGAVKVVKLSGNPSKRKTLKRVGLALKKWIRGNPSQGPIRWGVKYSWHEPFGAFTRKSDAQAEAKLVRDANRQAGLTGAVKVVKVFARNPSRVQGRKVKGGRAVTLKNMKSVTITRHPNGAVSVRGVQLKGRKR